MASSELRRHMHSFHTHIYTQLHTYVHTDAYIHTHSNLKLNKSFKNMLLREYGDSSVSKALVLHEDLNLSPQTTFF